MRPGASARGPLARRGRETLPFNRGLPMVYRTLGDARPEPVEQGPLARDAALARVEAALFVADEPLTAKRLATAAGVGDGTEARRLVKRLQTLYEQDGSAFQVEEVAGGFQLLTRPEFHPWLSRLRRANTDLRLSAPARETLAILAYRQPITRADVEAIRGVQCSDVIRQLMEKGLIRIAGRDDSLGRPVLYGTAKKFLQAYGLKSLRDLPEAGELKPPEPRKDEAEPEA